MMQFIFIVIIVIVIIIIYFNLSLYHITLFFLRERQGVIKSWCQ